MPIMLFNNILHNVSLLEQHFEGAEEEQQREFPYMISQGYLRS